MLQKLDKDRLDAVLRVLEERPIKPVNKTICEKLGEDAGNVSNYLNGKKPMPTNFYTSFMEVFGGAELPANGKNNESTKQETVKDSPKSENLESLIRSNENLTKANMDIAANVVVLTRMLDASSNAHQGTSLRSSPIRAEIMELLAPLVKDNLGLEVATDTTAALELDRRLTDIENRTVKMDKRHA